MPGNREAAGVRVTQKKRVERWLEIDIDSDGGTVFEIGTDDGDPAEITLADREVAEVIFELLACQGWRRLAKWARLIDTWITEGKERERQDRA